MTKPFNLTPKRLSALRLIQQRPGCYLRELIDICDRQVSPINESRTWSGFDRNGTGKQAATRWGASYARPLVKAGLVQEQFAVPGGARLYLTPLGRRVAIEGKMPDA